MKILLKIIIGIYIALFMLLGILELSHIEGALENIGNKLGDISLHTTPPNGYTKTQLQENGAKGINQ